MFGRFVQLQGIVMTQVMVSWFHLNGGLTVYSCWRGTMECILFSFWGLVSNNSILSCYFFLYTIKCGQFLSLLYMWRTRFQSSDDIRRMLLSILFNLILYPERERSWCFLEVIIFRSSSLYYVSISNENCTHEEV